MRISSIVVYQALAPQKIMSRALEEKSEEILLKEIKPIADQLYREKTYGICEIVKSKNFFYIKIDETDPIMIFTTDEKMTKFSCELFFMTICAANTTDELTEILQCAEQKRTQDKFAGVKQDIQEVKEVTVDLIFKLLERNEKLDSLESKMEELKKQSELFKDESIKLKKQLYCPNLYWLFTFAKRKFWLEPFEYRFYPTKPKSP